MQLIEVKNKRTIHEFLEMPGLFIRMILSGFARFMVRPNPFLIL
jgi:hypothetical protein